MCLMIYLFGSVILFANSGQCELSVDKVYSLLSSRLDEILVNIKLEQNAMKKDMHDLMATVTATNQQVISLETRLSQDLITAMTTTNQQVISLEKRLSEVATFNQQMVDVQERFDNMDSHVKDVASAEVGRRTHLLRRGLEQEKAATQSRFEKIRVQIFKLGQDFEGSIKNTSELSARVDIFDNKYDILKSEMKQTSEKTRAQIATVHQEVVTAQRNTQTLQSDLESKTRTIQTQVDTTRGQISRLQNVTGTVVGFSTQLTTLQPYYNKSTVIKFNVAYYNDGGHYSTSTGIFTVPVSGVYIFMINVQVYYDSSDKERWADIYLYINGQFKASAVVEGLGTLTGGNSAVVKVSAGDRVYVSTAGSREQYYIYPYRTTFSGALLHVI